MERDYRIHEEGSGHQSSSKGLFEGNRPHPKPKELNDRLVGGETYETKIGKKIEVIVRRAAVSGFIKS